jgi:hypothetical protein
MLQISNMGKFFGSVHEQMAGCCKYAVTSRGVGSAFVHQLSNHEVLNEGCVL